MRTRLITATITAVLLATVAACGQSYEQTTEQCAAALKDRAKGDKAKPEACADVKEDDYTALVMSEAIDDLGWTDENGDFDKNKMLDDALDEHQP